MKKLSRREFLKRASLGAAGGYLGLSSSLTLGGDNLVVGVDIDEPISLPRGACLDVIKGRDLKGKSVWQRAKALISIAHPQFRDELTEAACKAGFITRGTMGIGW